MEWTWIGLDPEYIEFIWVASGLSINCLVNLGSRRMWADLMERNCVFRC